MLFIAVWQVQAQDIERFSPQQQMEFYKAQIESAEQERNASKIAFSYGEIVTLCRENSFYTNELLENLYNYGIWSNNAGNHQTAINALIEILDMPDDNSNDKSLFTLKARANNELGNTYFFLKRWDNALVYYLKSRDMATALQNNHGISIAENNIGNIYQKKENYQQAIVHYRRCLQLQEEIDDKETICNTYHNLATCYCEINDLTAGQTCFDLSLNMAKEIDDKEIEALCLVGLALYIHPFPEAIKRIAQAEEIAKEAGYNQVLAEIYQAGSVVHEKYGNFAPALEYFKAYKALSDTLFNEQSMSQLNEYEVRYQTQEKELEITRQRTEIDRQRSRQYLYLGGLAAAGLLVVMLLYIVRLRTRRARLLAETNATKDKFFSIISHDLKNPAFAQRNDIRNLFENFRKWDADYISEYCGNLLKSANDNVELLQSLLSWSQTQTGRMTYQPVLFDLVAGLKSGIGVIQSMANEKEIRLDMQMPAPALITGDERMLGTVVRNLLVNAVKFTAHGGTVTLAVEPAVTGWK